jgi:hypothetical protein
VDQSNAGIEVAKHTQVETNSRKPFRHFPANLNKCARFVTFATAWLSRVTGEVRTRPREPGFPTKGCRRKTGFYFNAKSFSNSSFDSRTPFSVIATDLALVAGFEM